MGIIRNPNSQRARLRSAIGPYHPDPSWSCLGLRLFPGAEQCLILLALFRREHVPNLRPGLRLHLPPHSLTALLRLFLTYGPGLSPALLEHLAETGLLLGSQ